MPPTQNQKLRSIYYAKKNKIKAQVKRIGWTPELIAKYRKLDDAVKKLERR